MNWRDLGIFSLLAGVLLTPVRGLSQNYRALPPQSSFPFKTIRYIGTEHGLSHPTVSWMMQDKRGFLWFMTLNGLCRYDGYEFKSWSYSARDAESIPTGYGWGLSEDKDGKIWIAHETKGIYVFDPYTETYQHIDLDTPGGNSVRSNWTMGLTIDKMNVVWIATTAGLFKYNPESADYQFYRNIPDEPTSIHGNVLYAIVTGDSNPGSDVINLWLVNDRLGVDGFNTTSGKAIVHFDYPDDQIQFNWVGKIFMMDILGKTHDVIWLGSNDEGILGVNTKSGQYVTIASDIPCQSSGHIIGLYATLEDNAGNLWTANDNNQIVYYNSTEKQFYTYDFGSGEIYVRQSDIMIYEDRNHNIWYCTPSGLICIDTHPNAFRTIQFDPTPESMANNFVSGLQPMTTGGLLMTSGVIGTFDVLYKKFTPMPELKDKQVPNYQQDQHGRVWFCGPDGFLRFDPGASAFDWHQLIDSSGDNFAQGIRGVVEDDTGQCWAYGVLNGIVKFDPAKDIPERVPTFVAESTVVSEFSYGIKHSLGELYFSGPEVGLMRFDPMTMTYCVYHHVANDPYSVSCDNIVAYLEDAELIWFGTQGGGIMANDPATERFVAFTSEHGLPSDFVVSLVKDSSGTIWAGTNNGIASFVPPVDPFVANCAIQFRNYNINDGLPVNQCIGNAAVCVPDGTVYFGTAGGGLVYFRPEEIRNNTFLPPVYITQLQVNNRIVSVRDSASVLKSAIEYTDTIRLKYRQNIITLGFSALNFINSERNRYAYMLEGYDPDWIYTDAGHRYTTYTNLDAGEYVYKVKGSNNDGAWSSESRNLILMIAPPFWQTNGFRLLISALSLGVLYLFYRLKMQQVLAIQHLRNKISADLHDDIGSTLNSISVYSEVARKDPSRRDHALAMIGESSRKIMEVMSDIVWTINPDNDTFDKLMLRMRSILHNLMRARNIAYSFSSDESLHSLAIPVQVRRNFYLIFREALNNLVKYSQASSTTVSVTRTGRQIVMTISDNGIGFDLNQVYNGNGIRNMRRRASEMHAALKISSNPNHGTSIELKLTI